MFACLTHKSVMIIRNGYSFLTFDGVPEGKVSKEKDGKKKVIILKSRINNSSLVAVSADVGHSVAPAAQRSLSLLVCSVPLQSC